MPKVSRIQKFSSLIHKKKGLLKCVFSTLIFQVFITILVVYFLHKNNSKILEKGKKSLLFLIPSFIIMLVLIYFMVSVKMPFYRRFILFIVFSILEGIILHLATKYVSNEVILSALLSTISIFSTFVVIGFILVYFGIDINWIGLILFFVLLGIIITRIVFYFVPPTENKKRFITSLSIFLFSVYILYDTNNILLKYQDTGIDCVRGALDYYLDILNLFLNLLDRSG